MDKTAPGRWLGRHPVIWGLIVAIAVGAPPGVQFVSNPSLPAGVLMGLGLAMGGLLGFVMSVSIRRGAGT